MRILVADDHPIIVVAIGEMLRTALGAQLTRLDTVTDSTTLLSGYHISPVDVLVLEPMLPGALTSIPLIERLVELRPDVPVVVYAGTHLPLLALHALGAGARAFVSKASGVGLAVEAVRVVSGGGTFLDPHIDLDAARHHPWNTLTPGERSVIVALAGGANLATLASDTGRSYKTVTAHKYNALRKLRLSSKTDLKHYLSEIGLDYLIPCV
jgi:DNA-binding NarL/FixJ family response regulator